MLFAIARAVDNPIQIERTTLNLELGFYASMLIKIDYTLLVPNRIRTEGFDEGFW